MDLRQGRVPRIGGGADEQQQPTGAGDRGPAGADRHPFFGHPVGELGPPWAGGLKVLERRVSGDAGFLEGAVIGDKKARPSLAGAFCSCIWSLGVPAGAGSSLVPAAAPVVSRASAGISLPGCGSTASVASSRAMAPSRLFSPASPRVTGVGNSLPSSRVSVLPWVRSMRLPSARTALVFFYVRTCAVLVRLGPASPPGPGSAPLRCRPAGLL